jgi:hypothetical protein
MLKITNAAARSVIARFMLDHLGPSAFDEAVRKFYVEVCIKLLGIDTIEQY